MELMNETEAEAWVAAQTAKPNRSVFELPPFGEGCAAYCLYFYYFTDIHYDGQGNLLNALRIYYHDNGKKKLSRKKLKKIVKKLVFNARRDMLRDPLTGAPAPKGFCPPACGESFEEVLWRRQSYVVVAVDDPKWKLPKRNGTKDAIAVTEHSKTCNHTFFQALEWDVKMPPNAPNSAFDHFQTTAIAFRNHMVSSEAGSPLGDDEAQAFNFAILVENERGQFTDVPIDPDGNNMGPPIGPP
jgi:hypothetical protein